MTPDSRSSAPPAARVEFVCQRCTACCRWPGEVRLRPEEIPALARFLSMCEFEFVQRYTRLRRDRRGLSLIEQADGACIFLVGRDCAVQAVKPRQCRDFPNHWNFPGWREVCQAVPVPVARDGAGG